MRSLLRSQVRFGRNRETIIGVAKWFLKFHWDPKWNLMAWMTNQAEVLFVANLLKSLNKY